MYHTGHAVCIHADSSDRIWDAVVSQVMAAQLQKPDTEQKYEPLAILGAELTGTEINWTTIEKEGYAKFRVFEKLDYMLRRVQPVHIFTDHRHLLFVFAPQALETTIGTSHS